MEQKIEKDDKELGVREKILNAATELFARGGYHGTSMKDIARQAGVNKALLFYYFNSKENLHHELIKSIPESLMKCINEEMRGLEDSFSLLRAVVKGYVRHFSLSRFKMRIMVQSFLGMGPESPIRMEEILETSRKPLVDVLEVGVSRGCFKDINCYFTASAILGMIQIFYRVPSNTDREYNDEEILANIFEIIEKGILTGVKADE